MNEQEVNRMLETAERRLELDALRRCAALAFLAAGLALSLYAWLASRSSLWLDTGALSRMPAVARFQEAEGRNTQAAIVALGDSITLSAVDCRLLDSLGPPDGPASYNLSIPSKSNIELLLDSNQPLVQHAGHVVIFVHPASTFAPAALRLGERRANLLRLLDCPLPEEALAGYERLVPDSGIGYLQRPRLLHAVDSRWRLVQDCESRLRLALPFFPERSQKALRYRMTTYSTDLKAVSLPIELTAEETRQAHARRLAASPGLFDGAFTPAPLACAAFEYSLKQLADRCQSVVLVITPLHPLMEQTLGEPGLEQFRRQVYSYQSGKVKVLDFSGMLDAAGFRDEIHMSQAGAQLLTSELARQLGWIGQGQH